MRIVIQNVINANVSIDNKIVGQINKGYCLFVGFTHDDNEQLIDKMIDKLLSLRIFPDENGKTNLSIFDVKGEILSISQFTLYANLKEGRRPSFVNAMKPDVASKMYDYFNSTLKKSGLKIEKGVFGADMKVSLINDGPFTTILDSKELFA